MEELPEGLVPGLPERLRGQIMARSEGVPLYAVETVRMLLDRGLLAQEGPVYRPTGEIETLEVPETLHALIAARLDGVSAEERRLLQDGAVLGKTFTLRALEALSGTPAEELEPLLSGLVRKEVLGVQSDPRSPERGQYGFLQDLVRHVAYETLSKRERKSRHLAAAAQIEQAFAQEEEVAEVLASHYLAAFEADPEADDAQAVKAKAGEMLSRAGERASSLGAPEEGRRYYEQAAALADEPLAEAALLEQAGRLDQAVEQLEQGTPSAALAAALAQLGRVRALGGHWETAAAPLERALTLAERLQLPDVFVEALTSKAVGLLRQGRLAEARILLEAAGERAHAEQLYGSALRAQNNLAVVLEASDRWAEAVELSERNLGLARRRGDRRWESQMRTGGLIELFL